MRQPQAGCNAPSAIITAAAQFTDIADVTPRTCSSKPIDYSYSLGYHVSFLADCSRFALQILLPYMGHERPSLRCQMVQNLLTLKAAGL